ncbi:MULTISPECIES: DUF4354 family protein [Pseudomonas]|jgi:hypothetical protein|uniref:DUF4354 family protein n=1 Tax=Pseudomonas TaxID=286 RepID=UPI0007CF56CB|nr:MULTISPECIES: DUF4354 family protein [Pseudomonas]OAE14549.1 hypothetical protein A2T76_24610 [Pseudomonas brenneri]MBJ2260379.1 DUF4354 family protein [Pseudomonas sp. MF6787]MBU4627805.1 DUF4354 family protein [Pseudomonas sp. BF61]MDI3205501.1 DUF4354 family protein [Pseudomonas shahriarae]QYM66267.1 DUF4354 family protein [Pseudomonas sp. So3.2b]
MKFSSIIAPITLSLIALTAHAKGLDHVIVVSTQKSSGTMSVGDKSAYTQSFDIFLGNLKGREIDLAGYCLKAYGIEGQEYKLDTVDEALTVGKLKVGAPVQGMAMFSSVDSGVYQPLMIKLSGRCK